MQPSFLIYIFALPKIKAYMKQTILPTLFVLLGSTLNAQIQKGSILLGGSLGYNSSNYTIFSSTSNATISPRVSYAIGNNSVIGISGNFSHGKSKAVNSDDKVTSIGYSASAFWRRYFPVQNKLGWYSEFTGGIGGSSNKREIMGGSSKTTTTSWTAGAIPGVYFQALPKLVINANVGGINYYRSKDKGSSGITGSKNSAFNVNFLSTFNFGVDFIIGKKSQG
jgi:hypothetical protein